MQRLNRNENYSDQFSESRQRSAYQLIRQMLAIEKPLAEYETYAKTQQDTWQRMADLHLLDIWYRRNIGVAFHLRHEFRSHLFALLNEKTCSISDFHPTAGTEFVRVNSSTPSRLFPIRGDSSV